MFLRQNAYKRRLRPSINDTVATTLHITTRTRVHSHADFGNMHCMSADLSALLRLLQNLIRLATSPRSKGAKARVQLGPTLTTEWLKLVTPRAGS